MLMICASDTEPGRNKTSLRSRGQTPCAGSTSRRLQVSDGTEQRQSPTGDLLDFLGLA